MPAHLQLFVVAVAPEPDIIWRVAPPVDYEPGLKQLAPVHLNMYM